MGRRSPRGVATRRSMALRGLVVVLVIALGLVAAWVRVTGKFSSDAQVSAQLRNAGGSLLPGSDVKIAGVIVGKVTGVRAGPQGTVRVGIDMPSEDLDGVPANVVARILPATVFGTSFVDLVVHDSPAAGGLKSGAVIPADSTQDTLELQQALDDIDRLVKALGPAELASAIGSTAQALDGRGEQIGRIIETADAYLRKLNPEMPLVRSDLSKLASNLRIVDRIAPQLLDATEDGLVTLDTIVDQEANIMALIAGGTNLAGTTRIFLARNQSGLVRLLDGALGVVDALYDNRVAGITDAIRTNIAVANKVPTGIKHGFLDSYAPVTLVPPPYYTRAQRPSYPRASGRVGLSSLPGSPSRGEG